MSRDPVGYPAGVNIVIFVWDSPVNRVDPTGMMGVTVAPPVSTDDPQLPAGGPSAGPAIWPPDGDIAPRFDYQPNCSNSARVGLIKNALGPACDCIVKASDLLNAHRQQVIAYYTLHNIGIHKAFLLQNIDFYAEKLSTAAAACYGTGSCRLRFDCCDECGNGWSVPNYKDWYDWGWGGYCIKCTPQTPAYVMIWGIWGWHRNIHLCPAFWESGPTRRSDTLVHEIGRLCGKLYDSNTGTIDDVYQWNFIVDLLCRDYTRILEHH